MQENILYTTCFAEHDPAEYWPILSAAEQKLAKQRVTQHLQDQVVLSYGLRRSKLAAILNQDPKQLTFELVANKKPILSSTPVHFNVAHTETHWVLLINTQHPIGVDIESMQRSVDFLALAERFFAPSEVELMQGMTHKKLFFWKLWTAKEALLKASGIGLQGLEDCVLAMDAAGHLYAQTDAFQAWQIEHIAREDDMMLTIAVPRN